LELSEWRPGCGLIEHHRFNYLTPKMNNMSGYEATIRLAKENRWYNMPFGIGQGDWLKVVKACYEEAVKAREFAGSWVANRVGWFPGLRTLVKYGILEKVGETVRAGRRAYYRMPDPEGVKRALEELGIDP